MRILSVNDNMALCDAGKGETFQVDISIVDVKIGDYVITNNNYAIRVIPEEEAKAIIKLWQDFKEKER